MNAVWWTATSHRRGCEVLEANHQRWVVARRREENALPASNAVGSAHGERKRCQQRVEDLLRGGEKSRYVKMLRAAVAPFRWLASIRSATLASDSGEPTAWQKDRS